MSSVESSPNAHISGSAIETSDKISGRNRITPVVVQERAYRACDKGSAACRFTGVQLASTADKSLDVTLGCASNSCEVTSESLQCTLDRLVAEQVEKPSDIPKPYSPPLTVAKEII